MSMVIGNIQASIRYRYYFAPILGFVKQILSIKIKASKVRD